MMMDANATPAILPSPPVTTTAKDKTITSTPSPGVTEIVGAVKAPASAAQEHPAPKVSIKIFPTLIHIAELISRSCMTLMSMRPNWVFLSTNIRVRPTNNANTTIRM
jgi:hypothetical protein